LVDKHQITGKYFCFHLQGIIIESSENACRALRWKTTRKRKGKKNTKTKTYIVK
jgi:hypothetical protein